MRNQWSNRSRRSAGICVALVALSASLIMITAGCGAGSRKVAAADAAPASAPTEVETVRVIAQTLHVNVTLPGELQPYEVVAIYPKVTGFVQWIGVDRGSRVRRGQILARLVAPEIVSQKAEARARLQSAENRRIEAEAKLASDTSTYQRLKVAATTPGVISDEELEVAGKTADADRARVVALRNNAEAARATLRSFEEIENYLCITAPFDGVITERNVHPGALVGPSGGQSAQLPMLRIEHDNRLRLVVAVPEVYAAGVEKGALVSFSVPSYPGLTFSGAVARLAESVDVRTRTMPVEVDVWNPGFRLHAGMFPQVVWPVRRASPTLFVPQSAVSRTMEQTFVIRIRDGKTEWVSVKTGAVEAEQTEVFGGLQEGDEVALHASEELHPGMTVSARLAR
ncbi:MAG: efflux RND transporter periplasmic adaptor subunit [Acidobacteriota bacterium]|nr:efflux RND transporter periplasmic adaptor subunit [Acidobacteriota bacterium]